MSLALMLVATCIAAAQQTHVHAHYASDIDTTIVDSDVLYVINMPAQFMTIRLEGAYAKQGKPTQLPGRINVILSSYSLTSVYEAEASHRLRVKADDQILDFGLLTYVKSDEDKAKAIRSALPSIALVGATSKSKGLTLESMAMRNVSLGELAKLASAASVVMKLGDTVFPLTPMQMSILREFVQVITPEKIDSTAIAKVDEPVVPLDVPSDANHAPLEQTLKWIKTELDREGSTKNLVLTDVPRKLEPLDFNTCRIRYRLEPLRRETTVSNTLIYAIMEYRIDLGDLNPMVTTSNLRDLAILSLTTRAPAKIKVFKHANEHGTMGRTLDESDTSSVLISLKSIEVATRLRIALIHAINLCYAQP
ncbi:MAG TPA: hypothetical protein VGC60_17595 [Pyrinomonadaceae bacterium]